MKQIPGFPGYTIDQNSVVCYKGKVIEGFSKDNETLYYLRDRSGRNVKMTESELLRLINEEALS